MAESVETPEVVIRLVVDSARAEKELEKLGEKAKSEGEKVKTHMSAMDMISFGAFAKMGSDLATRIYGYAKHAVMGAAQAEEAARRQIVGTLAMIDQTGEGFGRLYDKATMFSDEITNIAVKTGVATDAIRGTFTELLQHSGQTADKVLELTEAMTRVGKVMPGGGQSLTYGFRMLEYGMVSARNPLVRLIVSTGTLSGNLRSIQQQLQAMTPEKRFETASKAVEKMANTLKDAKPTITSLVASMEKMGESLMEDFGVPVAQGLATALKPIRDMFEADRGKLGMSAMFAGKTAGRAIAGMPDAFMRGNSFMDGDVSKPNLGAAIEQTSLSLSTLATGAATAAGAMFKLVEYFPNLYTALKFIGQTAENDQTAADKDHYKLGLQGPMGTKARGITMQEAAAGLGFKGDNGMYYMREPDPVAIQGRRHEEELKAQLDLYQRGKSDPLNFVPGSEGPAYEKFSELWNDAMASNSASAQANREYLGRQINAYTGLEEALINGRVKLDDGIAKLVQALDEMGLKDAADRIRKGVEKGVKGQPPNNFYGNVYIQQDFKDQDPDRVALVFQKDLARRATAPTQSPMTLGAGW